jgi:ring-1,2-phenylacetyl-CoA epoxidase subunit PaaD
VALTGPGAQRIAEIAGAVPDPELPMVSLANLGVLRAVDVNATTGRITVTITPTYIGCPAMATMAEDIVSRLADAGYADVSVHKVLGGDWSSDDLTAAGRKALQEGGIAPPAAPAADPGHARAPVACPQCGSETTEQLSPFGATSCKALFRCLTCREPFEYFKVH